MAGALLVVCQGAAAAVFGAVASLPLDDMSDCDAGCPLGLSVAVVPTATARVAALSLILTAVALDMPADSAEALAAAAAAAAVTARLCGTLAGPTRLSRGAQLCWL